jgi:hypothetical protein
VPSVFPSIFELANRKNKVVPTSVDFIDSLCTHAQYLILDGKERKRKRLKRGRDEILLAIRIVLMGVLGTLPLVRTSYMRVAYTLGQNFTTVQDVALLATQELTALVLDGASRTLHESFLGQHRGPANRAVN